MNLLLDELDMKATSFEHGDKYLDEDDKEKRDHVDMKILFLTTRLIYSRI